MSQHRRVGTAIAGGDLSARSRDVRGEILQLNETLNTMVDQLNRLRRRGTRLGAESSPKASRRSGQLAGVAGT